MPRPRKGPRLYLRRHRKSAAVWVILDGQREFSTNCRKDDLAGAERALEGYIAGKYTPPDGPARPEDILIADAVHAYVKEHAPRTRSLEFLIHTSRPLLDWWGGERLAAIKGESCRRYVVWRVAQGVSEATARHDLKTLSAAVRYYHREHGPLSAVPVVTLPEKAPPRDRWLTRSEVAQMLWAARAHPSTRHVARFILVAIYTGTRSRAVLDLQWVPTPDGGYFDLDGEVLYRRGQGRRQSRKRQPPARIDARLLQHLRRWRRRDLALGISFVVHYHGVGVGKLRRSWDSVRQQAGLGAEVVPHTCRHTAATWQMQAGTDHFEAAGYLGMSVETLLKVYGHHHPNFQAAAAQANLRRRQRRRRG